MFYVCSYVKNKTRSNVRYSVTQLVKPKSAIGVEYDLVGPKAADVRGPDGRATALLELDILISHLKKSERFRGNLIFPNLIKNQVRLGRGARSWSADIGV